MLPSNVYAQAPSDTKSVASDWNFTLGAAGRYSADYQGSDDYDIKPLPLAKISWRDTVSIGSQKGGPGLKVNFLRVNGPSPKDRFVISTSLGYFSGRDQDDNDALQGLGDLNGGVTATLTADYKLQKFGVFLSVIRDMSGDREGTTANAGLGYTFVLGSPKTQLTLGPSVTWADDSYMENVFGISATQAASSALSFSEYRAASGINDVGVNVSVRHSLNQNVGIMGQIGYKQLLGDASDSPIVKGQGSSGQLSALFGTSYNW
jgi:outer membrane scaffolding protein for murein synthesis (MipA/OmpV family)